MKQETVRGVNLGGWLVLEKWIRPDLFAGTDAEDASGLKTVLSKEEFAVRMKAHRDTFITREDLRKIKAAGCNTVRLPVPWTMFDENDGSLPYVDSLMHWASEESLSVLIDLHTVPGGQNGYDNGGMLGICSWHTNRKNVDITLEVLERIVRRYAGNSSLWGIELVNEPISDVRFEAMKKRLKDKLGNRLNGSTAVPDDFLISFYQEAYKRLDPLMRENQKIVIHDGFRLSLWKDHLPRNQYPRLWIDTHMYLNFMGMELKDNRMHSYPELVFNTFVNELQSAEEYHPIIVGEWTCAHKPKDLLNATEDVYDDYLHAITLLQEMAFDFTHGWFYWNWRVDDPGRPNWDFRHVYAKGYLNMPAASD